jgi:hypothetical protein
MDVNDKTLQALAAGMKVQRDETRAYFFKCRKC